MKIIETEFNGLYIIESNTFNDSRGLFLKTFNQSMFSSMGLETEYKERYYSKSHKNVIRGMHFQAPPHDHIKIVNVLQGTILDVVVDLRKKSETYQKYFSFELNDHNGRFIYIPKGFAHGFMALTDDCIVEYNQTTEYNKDCDCGILYNSFRFEWGINNPIISDRDNNFQPLNEFITPF